MKVLEGDFSGANGRIVADVFKGDLMEINGSTYNFPKSFSTIKLLHKDERRPFLIIFLLCITVIGIPLAILLGILWKEISANVGFTINNGGKFIGTCNSSEWKVVRKYIAKGSLDQF